MIDVTPNGYDFAPVHEALGEYVSRDLLAMAASVVLKGQDVLDVFTVGFQDKEQEIPLALDSIYRIFSNTKIVTSVAAMMLWEESAFHLDDPLSEYFPEFSDLRVLSSDAKGLGDLVAPERPASIRELMSHTAGFSYGIFGESLVDKAYLEKGITAPDRSLEEMVSRLGDLPLAYQPGSRWQYSVSTDVLGRLIEIVSGKTFDTFLKERIFEPLGMLDTGFFCPSSNHDRLCRNYLPSDPMDPMKPGLQSIDESQAPYTKPRKFLSGGGGLVSTIIDYARFMQMLIGEGELNGIRILRPDTVQLMHTNQLPKGMGVQLPNWLMPDTVFGLGVAIKTAPVRGEPKIAVGEYHWGGVAGTHSWVSLKGNVAGLVFTQRLPGFWHPFSHDFKRLVYEVVR